MIWKQKSGKTLSPAIAKELMEKGRTEKQITFKGRSGRNFRAKLKLTQNEEGKWRVDFDEEWAQNAPPEEAPVATDGTEPAEPSSDGTGDAANGSVETAGPPPQGRGGRRGNFRSRRYVKPRLSTPGIPGFARESVIRSERF